ncbi:MAG TPA: VIT and VWA domain-containing protein [Vicinamibacteria bacterium]
MTEPVPAGLLTKGAPIPLEGVAIDAEIRDFCSKVTVTQRYRNREDKPIEAVYVFPLDERAAVCGFAAIVDGNEIVGEVKEREEAFERYDDALSEGHGAHLLDQERPDVFTARIGNLPPGKEALVRVNYVAELGLEGEDLRFLLPTTVSPRYAPLEDRKGVGRSEAEAVNPPVAWEVPYGLELTVRLEMASSIRGLESPSHPLAIEIDGASATVRLSDRRAALDSDFVLLVRLQEPHEPRAWLEEKNGEAVAMVAFQPRFESREAASEVIFVVDRSGSMGGSSIAEARNALQLCLRSLREGSWFNVFGFGSTYERLFPESRPYDEASLRQATEHVRTLEANLGGTEILPALEAAFASARPSKLPRQLIVMTDGQVSNTEAVLALVRKHAETTRVFTLGIGAGASHHLVRGMARAGEGEAELIYPGERIESKVLRQLSRALAPAVTDVRVSWGGLEVRQVPHRVPPVFAGGRVLVYGFLRQPLSREVEVNLDAKSAEGALSFSVPLSSAKKKTGPLVATLAARALLRDLEDQGEKEEGAAIGVKYGLSSKWTSFVAIEKRADATPREIELRRVPVALTRGWGGMVMGPARMLGAPKAAAASVRLTASYDAFARSVAPRPLDDLVVLQRADGSWDLDENLARILGMRLGKLRKKLEGATGDPGEAARAWATALALAWLESRAADSRDEWELLADKAKARLSRCGAGLAGGEDWLAAARGVVTARGWKTPWQW